MWSVVVFWIILLVYIVLVVSTVTVVLLENRQPAKTIAWTIVLVMLPVVGLIIFYFFGISLTYGNTVLGNLNVWLISYWLCWLVAAATAISGIKYLWDNRSFINTAK